MREKRLTPLRKLMLRVAAARQTSEQMLEIARMWTAALGGTVITRRKRDKR